MYKSHKRVTSKKSPFQAKMASKKSRVNVHSKLTAVSSKPIGSCMTHKLSALDHAMGLHSLHIIFYYKKSPFGFFDFNPLRESLSEVLSLYPPVTGRLTRGESGNWEVNCNDAGLRILRANVGVTIDEWLRSAHGLEEKDLTAWDEMLHDPSPFRIQINEFEGGGAAIGISCTHMLTDPTSVTLLLKSWINTHRGESIEHPPFFQPYIVNNQSVLKTRMEKSANYHVTKADREAPAAKMATATFKFSDATIQQCLKEVHDICPEATPFDLLAALFWICIAGLSCPKHCYSLSICLDVRKAMQPRIPLGYFSNALHFSLLSLNDEDMDCSALGNVVALVHQHMAAVCKEEVLSTINWLESRKENGGKYPPAFRMYGPELTCVCMEHMIIEHQSLMYGATFENNEKPIHVSCHVGNVVSEGLIMIIPSQEEGLARTVMVTLPEEEVAKLCEDEAILRLEPMLLFSGRQ